MWDYIKVAENVDKKAGKVTGIRSCTIFNLIFIIITGIRISTQTIFYFPQLDMFLPT